MTMGKIRRVIADFIRSRRVDDKRHPRFLAGYLAGMHDAKLEAETTNEDGIIRLEKWPEGHVLWYHGEIVWRSWLGEEVQNPPPSTHVEGDTLGLTSSEVCALLYSVPKGLRLQTVAKMASWLEDRPFTAPTATEGEAE